MSIAAISILVGGGLPTFKNGLIMKNINAIILGNISATMLYIQLVNSVVGKQIKHSFKNFHFFYYKSFFIKKQ